MKTILSTVSLLVLVFASAVSAQEEKEAAWFNMHDCEICSGVASVEGLMQHMKWEIHKIDNGCLAVTVLPADMKKAYDKAVAGMKDTITKVETGGDVKLCGYCNSFGALLQAGAKKKEIETAGGTVQLITSDDPALVKKIHTHVDRTIEETRKMMEAMGAQGGHEHSHEDHEHRDHTHDQKGTDK